MNYGTWWETEGPRLVSVMIIMIVVMQLLPIYRSDSYNDNYCVHLKYAEEVDMTAYCSFPGWCDSFLNECNL